MKIRLLRFVFLFMTGILLTIACTSSIDDSGSGQPPLKIGYSFWPASFPMEIAEEKGFFTEQGVDVEPAYEADYLVPLTNFAAGQYDGLLTTLGSLISLAENDPNIQIVTVLDESAGIDVVAASSHIDSIADLKGKRIGVKLGDFGELFVTTMLEQHGLTTDDVSLVNVEGQDIPNRLQTNDIQAGHIWEPYLSEAVEAGNRVIFSSKQTPGLIPDVVVFRSRVVHDRPEAVQAFVRGWFQAQDYWKTNPAESNAIIAKRLEIEPKDISTEGIRLYDLDANLTAFTRSSTTDSLYYTAKRYADFFIRKGGLSTAPDIEKLIVPTFVQQVKSKKS